MRQVLVDLMNPDLFTQGILAQIGAGEDAWLFHTDPITAGNLASHPIGGRGQVDASWGGTDPRWTISNTVTWLKGNHAFKGGIEYRRQSSTQEYSGLRAFSGDGALAHMPVIYGGITPQTRERRRELRPLGAANTAGTAWQNLSPTALDIATAEPSGNYLAPYQMMSYFSGSVLRTHQYFYMVPDGDGVRWNDPLRGERHYAYTLRNHELAFFFKDDWKITNDLTLNLGIRYEYYGVPHVSDGRTLRLQGDSFDRAFGISRGGWDNWMNNRQLIESPFDPFSATHLPNFPTAESMGGSVYHRVGPGSPNPNTMVWNRDLNNFGPHLGFSWQLPWFGRGLTAAGRSAIRRSATSAHSTPGSQTFRPRSLSCHSTGQVRA
jgi:hypothetical protein